MIRMVRYGTNYTMEDVIWALEQIEKFIQFKSKFNKFLKKLATKGIDISQVDLNNPVSILPVIIEAQSRGVNISISELKEITAEFNNISFADVERAVSILNSYFNLVRSVEYNLRKVISEGKMSMGELSMLAQLFGLRLPHFTADSYTEDSNEEDKEVEYEDLIELRNFLKKIKSSE